MKKLSRSAAALFILLLSCTPSGELSRTIHPPHQRFFDRKNPAPPPTTAETATSVPTLLKGLPPECRTTSEKPLCVSCDNDNLLVTRCYDYEGTWTAMDACHYDKDTIKCLTKSPPFALYLDYNNSEEKLFRENVQTWTSAVQEIWKDKLTGDEQKANDTILKTMAVTSQGLLGSERIPESERKEIERLLGADTPSKAEAISQFATQVEADRLKGQLKLSQVLIYLQNTVKTVQGEAKIFERYAELSLDGLEEP